MLLPEGQQQKLQTDDIRRLHEMVRNGTTVWIKRTSGELVKGHVQYVTDDGQDVSVVFRDEIRRPGRDLTKVVSGRDLLDWQDEYGEFEEAVEGETTGVRLVQKNVRSMIQQQDQMVRSQQEHASGETDGLPAVESINGLPVISAEDYLRLYETDIRALGAHGAATFNFQGYVREDRPGYESRRGTYYHDALATNGILKGKGHEGIHVGTDGIVDYREMEANSRMRGPEAVAEYNIYIRVPTQLQRQLGVVVRNDSCVRADELEEYGETAEELYERQESFAERMGEKPSAYIVVRLRLAPKKDPRAREKVVLIHNRIVQYIENGKPLDQLTRMINAMDEELSEMTPRDFQRKYPALEPKRPLLGE